MPTSISSDLFLLREVDAGPIAGLDTGLLALALLELQAGLGVEDDDLRCCLREGDIDRLPFPQAEVEFVREAGILVDARRDAFQAAHAEIFLDVAGLPLHLDFEVADVALDLGDLGIGPERDVGVGFDGGHLGGQDARRAIQRREGLVEHGHMAADGRLALDEVDVLPGIGQRERGVDAGNAASYDQHGRVHRDPLALQRLVGQDAVDGSPGEVLGLFRRGPLVLMDPGDILPDADHLEVELIEACGGDRMPEGVLVEERGARRHDDPVQVVFPDVLLDQFLPRVGAHVLVLPGEDDVG